MGIYLSSSSKHFIATVHGCVSVFQGGTRVFLDCSTAGKAWPFTIEE